MLNLTAPEDREEEVAETPDHPIQERHVEKAKQYAETEASINTLHEYLETLQSALQEQLIYDNGNIYDPLDLVGELPHTFAWKQVNSFKWVLYLEEGKHRIDEEWSQRAALAADELPSWEEYDDVHDWEDDWHQRQREIDLSDYSEEEIYEASEYMWGIWESKKRTTAADVLELDERSETYRAIQLAHELEYENSTPMYSEHGETGFVIGIPALFFSGMMAEQRMFSQLASMGMTTAQLTDVYGSRVSYNDDAKWASKRGVSASAVSQNRDAGRNHLRSEYDPETLPVDLF